jgi:F0F1-type ATP synthase membrane subunit c/vacuolar-type H+-ATPase subunit K
MVTTVVPASVLGVVVLPLAGTTLVLLVLLEPSAGLGMGIGTVVLGVVDGVVVTGAVYTTRMARRSRIRASRPNRRAGVVVVTTVGTVGAAGAVAAGFGAGGSAAQTIALNPHTAATLNRDFIIVLPPETSCTSSDPGSTSSTQSIRCTQFSNPSWLCKAPKGKINMPQVIELEAP